LRHRSLPRGCVLDLEQTWRLSRAWYLDPRDLDWRPRSIEESRAVFSTLGLDDDFWQRPP
jgi:hypothetical protein